LAAAVVDMTAVVEMAQRVIPVVLVAVVLALMLAVLALRVKAFVVEMLITPATLELAAVAHLQLVKI
jgi:integral membrane sensor domain MASE1